MAVSQKHCREATSLHAGIRHARHIKSLRRDTELAVEKLWKEG
jgi:hypothetical protein